MEHEASKEKGKVQLNNACCDIELYATAWKKEFWSTSIGMLRHHYLEAITSLVRCHDIEAEKN